VAGLVVAAAALGSAGSSGASGPTCRGQEATVIGTPGRDVYNFYNDAPDLAQGDVLVLKGGDDKVVNPPVRLSVCGGHGRDHLEAGPDTGRAMFVGGRGKDVLGSPGDEGERTIRLLIVSGGKGDDRLYGGLGHPGKRNLMQGGPGDDRGFGFLAEDLIRGGAGSDDLNGGDRDDRIYGGRGNDRLKGDAGHDVANGGTGRDQCAAEVVVHCEA
jgi:Ca2+-binding RTX toxin-like protein